MMMTEVVVVFGLSDLSPYGTGEAPSGTFSDCEFGFLGYKESPWIGLPGRLVMPF